LAIIIPAYNEEDVIGKVLESIPKAICGMATFCIVVDDGSTDATQQVAKKFGAATLRHAVNRGQGAAVQTGITAALTIGCDAIVMLDGDGQHNGEDIEHLMQPILTDQADIVNGSRFLKKQKIPALRRAYNSGANLITWLMSGYYLTDSQSGMKALGKKAAEKICIRANGYEFCSELVREASWYKFRVTEVPIHVSYSRYSMSKGQNFSVGITTLSKLVIRSIMK
jgi:glycosyltransferase involved in cell wall biosynthesis